MSCFYVGSLVYIHPFGSSFQAVFQPLVLVPHPFLERVSFAHLVEEIQQPHLKLNEAAVRKIHLVNPLPPALVVLHGVSPGQEIGYMVGPLVVSYEVEHCEMGLSFRLSQAPAKLLEENNMGLCGP